MSPTANPGVNTATKTAANPTGLAQRLRDGTRLRHQASERAGVMPALLRGQLPVAGFTHLQRNLHALYAALEPALAQHATHPVLAPLHLPGLARSQALAADLDTLHGTDWPSALPVLPATQAYGERLRHLAQQQPAALAAHAYVRYLGDLSGGQVLQRVVRQAYGLDSHQGTAFFDFGPPERVAALAQGFRQALNTLPVDEASAQALLAEALWSFDQHVHLFEQVSRHLQSPATLVNPAPPPADPAAPHA